MPLAFVGGEEAADQALAGLQQRFFPELVRNTELFAELFNRSARPALIRVRLPQDIKEKKSEIAWADGVQECVAGSVRRQTLLWRSET